MKTFEGTMTIKWYKNHSGDKRPLTIDTENIHTLNKEHIRIRYDFLNKGENEEFPFSVKFNMNERK